MSDPILNDAARIIEAFGGIRPMAKKLGVAVTTVQGWKERNAIPVQRLDQIREAAKRENIDLGPTSTPGSNVSPASKTTAGSDASATTTGPSAASGSAGTGTAGAGSAGARSAAATDSSPTAAKPGTGASTSTSGAARSSASAAGSQTKGSDAPKSGARTERVAAEKVSDVSSGVKRAAGGDAGKTVEGASASSRPAQKSTPPKSKGRAFAFGLGFAVVLLLGAAGGWYFKDAIVGAAGKDGAAVAALEKRLAVAEKSASEAKTAAEAAAAANAKLAAQVKATGAGAGNKAAVDKLSTDVSALRTELAAVKKAAAATGPAGATAKLSGDVTKLQAAVAALQKAVADGTKTTTGGDATGAAGATGAQTKAALDKLAADLAALNSKIGALDKQSSQTAQTAKDITTLNTKMAAMETRLKSAEASSGGGKASLIVALSQLRAAAASGQPFGASLKVAGGLAGADSQATPVLKSLESAAAKGAPTVPVLRSRFNALSSDLVAAAMRSQGDGWAGRAWNKLKSTVIVRRTGRDVKGAGPAALAAQAEVKLDDGDLAGAVALVRKMPAAAQTAAADWLADAERRVSIDAALKKLDALMPALSAGQK